jgi:hypothetical protein
MASDEAYAIGVYNNYGVMIISSSLGIVESEHVKYLVNLARAMPL